ncbi:MAG: hypothetical protein WB683_10660 [Candidatus Sulfotelmatobacter sp.]
MKTVLISIFSGALMLGVAYGQGNSAPAQSTLPSDQQSSSRAQPSAQQTATESATQARPLRIAPGSVIPVSLTKTVDAKKVKTGDEVVAKVTQDLKSNAGEVIVAKDTEVVGHVTEAQARNKEQKESQVGITFDHAVMRDGSEMQMPMSIQAVVGSQNSGPQNSGSSAAGNSEAAPSSGTGGYPSSPRAGGMGGSMPSPAPQAASQGNMPSDTQTGTSTRPRITAQTEGVVGISDLTLTSSSPTANQGSLLSSEKNNVKLESGTLMLLRVN